MHVTDNRPNNENVTLVEQLAFALEAADIGTWDYNLQTNQADWSPICKRLFGLPPSAHVSPASLLERVHPDDRERVNQANRKSLSPAADGVHNITFRTLSKDGQQRWVQAKGKTYKNSQGQVIRFSGIVQDITERKLAEEALRQSEEQLRLFVTASFEAVYTMSADWSQMHNLIGKDFLSDTQEPSHSWLHKYIPLEEQAHVQAAIEQAITARQIFELEHRIIRINGTIGWALSRAIPVLNEQGDILEWAGAATDITERKQAERVLRASEERYRALSADLDQQVKQRTQELEIAVQELRRSNDNLEQFAYIASHDLQEPLRKIQQFGTLLQAQYPNPSGNNTDYLARMQIAAQRMSTLIKDLLTYSRVTTRQDVVQPVSLDRLLNDVLDDLDLTIQESKAIVSFDSLPTVDGDPSQLRQLFINLLSNALKFRHVDVIPQIQISSQLISAADLPTSIKSVRPVQAYYRISVSDNGIGLDEKYADRIFHVFQRLHGKNEFAGTGVGLAICEKVTTNHGGGITVTSQPGKGSTFTVYFPD